MAEEERDPKLTQRYRELGGEEPSRELDSSILAASRRAAETRPAPLVAPTGRRRWYFPLAAAAVITLAVAVTLHVGQQPTDELERTQRLRLVERRQVGQPAQNAQDVLVDADGLDELRAPVDDAVPDGVDLPRRREHGWKLVLVDRLGKGRRVVAFENGELETARAGVEQQDPHGALRPRATAVIRCLPRWTWPRRGSLRADSTVWRRAPSATR